MPLDDEAKKQEASDKNRSDVAAYVKTAGVPNELQAYLVANNVLLTESKSVCEEYKAKGHVTPKDGPNFGEPPVVPKAAQPVPKKPVVPKDGE